MVKSIERGNVTEDAWARIHADLLTGKLRPGDRLKVDDLCKSLGYNLSAVREALSRLTSEGLVVYEPNRGYRAAQVSLDELRDLTAMRVEIEAGCLRSAILSGDLAWETGVVAALHSMLRTPSPTSDSTPAELEAWFHAHKKFHEALVAACTSALRLRIRSQLFTLSERYRRMSTRPSHADRDINREHQEIANAVLARDANQAVSLMSSHLERTTTYLVDVMYPHPLNSSAAQTGRNIQRGSAQSASPSIRSGNR